MAMAAKVAVITKAASAANSAKLISSTSTGGWRWTGTAASMAVPSSFAAAAVIPTRRRPRRVRGVEGRSVEGRRKSTVPSSHVLGVTPHRKIDLVPSGAGPMRGGLHRPVDRPQVWGSPQPRRRGHDFVRLGGGSQSSGWRTHSEIRATGGYGSRPSHPDPTRHRRFRGNCVDCHVITSLPPSAGDTMEVGYT
jgi:hypothetical protein